MEREVDEGNDESALRDGQPHQPGGRSASRSLVHGCTTGGGDPLKVVLSFAEFDTPRTTFHSELRRVPVGKRLWIEEVSLFVQLQETTDPPPVKAFAYLTTGQIELDEGRRFNVREPLGTIAWLDKSAPPTVGTTLGMLRTTMSTFSDQFVQATLTMNETIALGRSGGDTPLTHVTIVGYLVELLGG